MGRARPVRIRGLIFIASISFRQDPTNRDPAGITACILGRISVSSIPLTANLG